MIKCLIGAAIMGVAGVMLPILARGKENRSWVVFLLRKPIPMICFGVSVGLLICAFIILIRG